MTTLAPTVDAAGISAPSYDTLLARLQASYRSIYGSDVILDPDTQDGEFLAIFAAAQQDTNQAIIAAFNSFSPTFAQGAGLASRVKLNGITKKAASYSTVTVTLTGTAGAVIANGIAGDLVGQTWALPVSVTIGGGGSVDVTATAQQIGAITASAGTITKILTPTRGWHAVTNAAAAAAGLPVETDGALRQRQTKSVAKPALSLVEAISAAVGDVTGVGRYFVYENDTGAPDADGLPAHSIAVVCEGGDGQAIADAIASRKPPGIQTYGTTSRTVVDSRGVPRTIHFFMLTVKDLDVEVTIQALAGYVTTTGDLIQQAVQGFVGGAGEIEGLELGEDSYTLRLVAAAGLQGDAAAAATGKSQPELDVLARTFRVTQIRQCIHGGALSTADVVIAFNEAARAPLADQTLIVT